MLLIILHFYFRFWAHHANIDRHFEAWMNLYASPTSRSKYYYFPTRGFAIGCNLNDVISSTAPFLRLSKKRKSMTPYTIKVRWMHLFGPYLLH